MNYIELINEFWKQNRFKPFNDIDTRFYFFLLNECNIRGWLNPYELQTQYLEAMLQIKRKAIGEVRNRLKQRGMIDFICKNNNPTVYFITNCEVSNEMCGQLFPHRNNCGTIKVHSKVHSSDIPETYIKDLRQETEKEKPPKGGKKKASESASMMLSRYRSETANVNYRNFLDWTVEKLPYVSANINPLSEDEFCKLKAAFGSEAIVESLLNLENRKDLRKKYSSLYRTLINWCKRGNEST